MVSGSHNYGESICIQRTMKRSKSDARNGIGMRWEYYKVLQQVIC